jgi:hypothetical protein
MTDMVSRHCHRLGCAIFKTALYLILVWFSKFLHSVSAVLHTDYMESPRRPLLPRPVPVAQRHQPRWLKQAKQRETCHSSI